ncbi:aldose epimerase family protein [Oceanobacillus alkalisoli]|uniref:aldose epimerase family protein n=1 Tax=Oceanobacillus alkalisoli TaxID=2925113 RepID=UPI001F11BCB7|nr:aldose epimerase family protein [Oceanobacillus alkalisoli]MCF3944123.1 galactose mutarotase [Oceanobacillus alkalisoli]
MSIEVKPINESWKLIKLRNKNNVSVDILNYGGIITNLTVPDKNGNMENVVLSYADFDSYKNDPNYFGATIGRVAGRIANSKFDLEGTSYSLESNESNHHLHGGTRGFHQMLWDYKVFETDSDVGVELQNEISESVDGYPGNLKVSVTFKLKDNDELIIDYRAISDKTTVLTLTNHSYFNLNGNLKQPINNHIITLNSSYFIELDKELIPTGDKVDVSGTPFDFREGKVLGEGIENPISQNEYAKNGFDHYFIFDNQNEDSVILEEPNSGRVMTIKTDQPGIVIYTGNNLDNNFELAEGKSEKYLGVTLETQSSPASLEFEGFPSIVLKANEPYQKQTSYKFSIVDN